MIFYMKSLKLSLCLFNMYIHQLFHLSNWLYISSREGIDGITNEFIVILSGDGDTSVLQEVSTRMGEAEVIEFGFPSGGVYIAVGRGLEATLVDVRHVQTNRTLPCMALKSNMCP